MTSFHHRLDNVHGSGVDDGIICIGRFARSSDLGNDSYILCLRVWKLDIMGVLTSLIVCSDCDVFGDFMGKEVIITVSISASCEHFLLARVISTAPEMVDISCFVTVIIVHGGHVEIVLASENLVV